MVHELLTKNNRCNKYGPACCLDAVAFVKNIGPRSADIGTSYIGVDSCIHFAPDVRMDVNERGTGTYEGGRNSRGLRHCCASCGTGVTDGAVREDEFT